MSSSEFWLNWIVQLGIALGTLGAVAVALFGGWLRSKLVPPKLRLSVENPRGVFSPVELKAPDGSSRVTDSRWYHVRITNERRWSPATQTQILLLQVQEPDATGEFKVVWTGELPLRWRHQEVQPLVRTIGSPADCDLCSVVKEKWIELHPLIEVFSLKSRRREKCRLLLTLQARSIESDSNMLQVEVAWDGEWTEDTEQMARHTVVKTIS